MGKEREATHLPTWSSPFRHTIITNSITSTPVRRLLFRLLSNGVAKEKKGSRPKALVQSFKCSAKMCNRSYQSYTIATAQSWCLERHCKLRACTKWQTAWCTSCNWWRWKPRWWLGRDCYGRRYQGERHSWMLLLHCSGREAQHTQWCPVRWDRFYWYAWVLIDNSRNFFLLIRLRFLVKLEINPTTIMTSTRAEEATMNNIQSSGT